MNSPADASDPGTHAPRPANPRRGLSIAVGLLLAVILSGLAWRSLNFFSYHRLYTDSGVFTAVTHHLLAGKTLYREAWDHKPPMIYLIDALPLALGDGSVNAIRFFERFYAVAGVLALFFSLWLAFQNRWLAFMMALGFHLHFYDPEIFQGGNLTEEYGAVFVLIGIFLTLAARIGFNLSSPGDKSREDEISLPHRPSLRFFRIYERDLLLCFLSGFFFSLAAFTKEPFLLSAIPWFIFLALPGGQSWKIALRRSLVFLLGSWLPAALFFGYFVGNGIFWDWLDVVSYNIQYSLHSRPSILLLERVNTHIGVISKYIAGQTLTFNLAFLLGLAGACYPPFARKYHGLPWLCAAAFLLDCWATMISGYEIGHYYLQVVPSYILVAGVGGALLVDLAGRIRFPARGLLMVCLLVFLVLDFVPARDYIKRLSVPAGRAGIGALSQTLREKARAGDTLWCGLGDNAKYYLESGLLSPTRYLYIFEHHFLDSRLSTGQEKRDLLYRELTTHPPAFILLSEAQATRMRQMGLSNLVDWIASDYQKSWGAVEQGVFIYIRKDWPDS